MKKILSITALIAALFLAVPCHAQQNTQPYIDINTTVEREVTPNELYLQISIREKDYKGKKSLEQMQNEMVGALKANRIDITECLTLNYMGSEVGGLSLQPQFFRIPGVCALRRRYFCGVPLF